VQHQLLPVIEPVLVSSSRLLHFLSSEILPLFGTDITPTFSQATYSFVVGRQLVPDSPNGLVSTIGDFVVSSVTGSVTLDLVRVSSPTNLTVLGALGINGLSLRGKKLQLSHDFFLTLSTITFPLTAYLRASDNRTQCVQPTGTVLGPCQTIVSFALDVADFNPPCPASIYRFSPEQQQSVTWTEPMLFSISGAAIPFTHTHAPGDLFQEGATTVSYAAHNAQSTAQLPATLLACSFSVSVCYSSSCIRLMIAFFYFL
jgi:hypothetical protein